MVAETETTTIEWAKDARPYNGSLVGAPAAIAQTPPENDRVHSTFDIERILSALAPVLTEKAGRQELESFAEELRSSITQLSANKDLLQPPRVPSSGEKDAAPQETQQDAPTQPFQWLGPRVTPPMQRNFDIDAFFAGLGSLQRNSAEDRVAMAIADTSIAFAHSRFRKTGAGGVPRTRFKMLWLQDRYLIDGTGFEGAAIFGHGTVLLEDDINRLFDRCRDGTVLDEKCVYRSFRSVTQFGRDLWSLRVGHGTSVLDLMAGAEPDGAGSDRPIYGVELATSVVADTSGGEFHAPLIAGLAVASALSFMANSTTPLVMNVSMAFVGGPHAHKRGSARTHPTARALDTLTQLSKAGGSRRVIMTLPAGNHLQDALFAEASKVVWGVQPHDRTGSILEIWHERFAPVDSEPLNIRITIPSGESATITAPPLVNTYISLVSVADGSEVARLFRVRLDGAISDHLQLMVFRTETVQPGDKTSPPGFWEIDLGTNKALFWSQRDDTLHGLPEAGQQARLLDPSYKKFASSGDLAKDGFTQTDVRRDGSLSVLYGGCHSAPAPDGRALVTGAEHSRSQPSGAGRTYRFAGLELDLPSPAIGQTPLGLGRFESAEVTRALGGPLSANRLGRGVVRWSGTSMASAIAARKAADAFTGTLTGGNDGYREPIQRF